MDAKWLILNIIILKLALFKAALLHFITLGIGIRVFIRSSRSCKSVPPVFGLMQTTGTSNINVHFTYRKLSAALRPFFIRHGDYIGSCVGQMSQCEGMQNVVKAGNTAALGRKSLAVFRKQAASHSRSLTWNTVCDRTRWFKSAALLSVCRRWLSSATCSLAHSESHLLLFPCKQ